MRAPCASSRAARAIPPVLDWQGRRPGGHSSAAVQQCSGQAGRRTGRREAPCAVRLFLFLIDGASAARRQCVCWRRPHGLVSASLAFNVLARWLPAAAAAARAAQCRVHGPTFFSIALDRATAMPVAIPRPCPRARRDARSGPAAIGASFEPRALSLRPMSMSPCKLCKRALVGAALSVEAFAGMPNIDAPYAPYAPDAPSRKQAGSCRQAATGARCTSCYRGRRGCAKALT